MSYFLHGIKNILQYTLVGRSMNVFIYIVGIGGKVRLVLIAFQMRTWRQIYEKSQKPNLIRITTCQTLALYSYTGKRLTKRHYFLLVYFSTECAKILWRLMFDFHILRQHIALRLTTTTIILKIKLYCITQCTMCYAVIFGYV